MNPLEKLLENLDTLSEHLQPLQEFESLSQLLQQLSSPDSLRLNAAIAYTLHSLYYTLLKFQGEDLSEHPIKKEIENIKAYMGKIQEVQGSNAGGTVRIDRPRTAGEGPGRQLKGSTPLPTAGHLGWREEMAKVLKKQ